MGLSPLAVRLIPRTGRIAGFEILAHILRLHPAGSRLQGVLLTLGVLLAGCLVAGATEVGQYFTTYRSGDPADFLADFLALASGSVLVLIIFLSSKKTTTISCKKTKYYNDLDYREDRLKRFFEKFAILNARLKQECKRLLLYKL